MDLSSCSLHCDAQYLVVLVGDWEADPMPGLHTPGKYADGEKAVFPQPLCRSARATPAFQTVTMLRWRWG
jgi:hypothetical protein